MRMPRIRFLAKMTVAGADTEIWSVNYYWKEEQGRKWFDLLFSLFTASRLKVHLLLLSRDDYGH